MLLSYISVANGDLYKICSFQSQDTDVASIEPYYSNLYENFKKLCIGSMDATSVSCVSMYFDTEVTLRYKYLRY